MRLAGDIQVRHHLAHVEFLLIHARLVVIDPQNHVLTVELRERVALLHSSTGFGELLKDAAEIARTAATTARSTTAGATATLEVT